MLNYRMTLIACAGALSLAVALSPGAAQDKKMGNEPMAKDKMNQGSMAKDDMKGMKKGKMKDDKGMKEEKKMK